MTVVDANTAMGAVLRMLEANPEIAREVETSAEAARQAAVRLSPIGAWDLWEDSDLSADRRARIERMPRQRLGCGLTLAGIPNEESVHFIDDVPHVRCDCGDLHRLMGDVLAGFLDRVEIRGKLRTGITWHTEDASGVIDLARREQIDLARAASLAKQAVARLDEAQRLREEREAAERAERAEVQRQAQAERDRLDPAKIALELYADYPVGDLPAPAEATPARRRLRDIEWFPIVVWVAMWTAPALLAIGLIAEVIQGNWSPWALLWIPAGGFMWHMMLMDDTW